MAISTEASERVSAAHRAAIDVDKQRSLRNAAINERREVLYSQLLKLFPDGQPRTISAPRTIEAQKGKVVIQFLHGREPNFVMSTQVDGEKLQQVLAINQHIARFQPTLTEMDPDKLVEMSTIVADAQAHFAERTQRTPRASAINH